MSPLHGSGEKHASKFACGDRRQRTIEEDPDVATLAGARSFQRRRHVRLLTDLQVSQGVILPSLLVKVSRQEPASFVWQERVHGDGFLAQEVVLNNGVG